jgi:hypothetical protein
MKRKVPEDIDNCHFVSPYWEDTFPTGGKWCQYSWVIIVNPLFSMQLWCECLRAGLLRGTRFIQLRGTAIPQVENRLLRQLS